MGIYLNPGYHGFEETRRDIYVDKTGLISYINSLIGKPKPLVSFSRPRRFGKSFDANMLCAYYDKSCDSRFLFDDLEIAKQDSFETHLNRYNVISFDVTGFVADAKESKENVIMEIRSSLLKELREEFSMADPLLLSEYVGFTEEDVQKLCSDFQADFAEMKQWYDGYSFEDVESAYSPNSVISAIAFKRFRNYWTKTETFESLRNYIDENFDGLKDAIIMMPGGQRVKIDVSTFKNDITSFSNRDDVMTLLIHLGYLAYDLSREEVYIPNREVAEVFRSAAKGGKWRKVEQAIDQSEKCCCMKRLGIACFTARGGRVADSVAVAFEKEYEIVRYEGGKGSLKEWCGGLFETGANGIIFVGACGIAVRTIAPFIKSKTTDPAVLVVDEAGQFVISLLSGHIGGANRLAVQAAEILGATPVITTATDVNGKFAVDVFAKKNGLRIGSMKAAKEISAAILRGEKVGVLCEGRIEGELPPELVLMQNGNQKTARYLNLTENDPKEKARIWTGALISIGLPFFTPISTGWMTEQAEPDIGALLTPSVFLKLYPKAYILGIGCRKGKSEQEIERAVDQALLKLGITMEEIAGAASIDLKKEEPGLLEFCRKNELRFQTYPAEVLAAVEGDFSPSPFVKNVTGVDNVCERAALCMAGEMFMKPDSGSEMEELPERKVSVDGEICIDRETCADREESLCTDSTATDATEKGGRLVLKKQAADGVTVAVAEQNWNVRF